MSERIPISAVIPSYNRAAIISKAIESILAQVYAPFEIIVVDDGSTDNTDQVIQKYGKVIRYVYQENAGVSAARNRGMEAAKCEWVAFLDSDDYWTPYHLGRMANAIFATNGEAALYFADMQRSNDAGPNTHWQLCGFAISRDFEFRSDAGDWALMHNQPMMLQSSVIRRRTYLNIGGLPNRLLTREDTLLFFKLALLYPACAVSGCGAVMNATDAIRLTQVYDRSSVVYCYATIAFFRELLSSLQHISRERRRLLVNCLSASYFAFSRSLFRQRKYGGTIKNLFISCLTSPMSFAEELAGTIGRYLSAATK